MSHQQSVPERQSQLYTKLWNDRADDVASADLIRHRVWRRYLEEPVLDVGAGDGVLARRHPGLKIISVDLTGAGLVKVQDRGAIVGSAERIPLRGDHFATVVLSEVLEHVSDPRGTLAECYRVLRPGGRLLLSVPLMPLSKAEWLYHRIRTGEAPTDQNLAVWDPNHERRFSLREITECFCEPDWKIEAVHPLFRSPSTFGMYYLEPRLGRLIRRRGPVHLAQHLARLDGVTGKRAAASGVAVIAQRI